MRDVGKAITKLFIIALCLAAIVGWAIIELILWLSGGYE